MVQYVLTAWVAPGNVRSEEWSSPLLSPPLLCWDNWAPAPPNINTTHYYVQNAENRIPYLYPPSSPAVFISDTRDGKGQSIWFLVAAGHTVNLLIEMNVKSTFLQITRKDEDKV